MAAVHRITEDSFEDPFVLIALHSDLEVHSLVYALNQHLGLRLRRRTCDLDLSSHISFPLYEWIDVLNDRVWYLIVNQCIKEGKLLESDLFGYEKSFDSYYLVPESKEVDYLLKVEVEHVAIAMELVRKLLKIPRVITAYTMQTDKLKSKDNLIF